MIIISLLLESVFCDESNVLYSLAEVQNAYTYGTDYALAASAPAAAAAVVNPFFVADSLKEPASTNYVNALVAAPAVAAPAAVIGPAPAAVADYGKLLLSGDALAAKKLTGGFGAPAELLALAAPAAPAAPAAKTVLLLQQKQNLAAKAKQLALSSFDSGAPALGAPAVIKASNVYKGVLNAGSFYNLATLTGKREQLTSYQQQKVMDIKPVPAVAYRRRHPRKEATLASGYLYSGDSNFFYAAAAAAATAESI